MQQPATLTVPPISSRRWFSVSIPIVSFVRFQSSSWWKLMLHDSFVPILSDDLLVYLSNTTTTTTTATTTTPPQPKQQPQDNIQHETIGRCEDRTTLGAA